MKKQQDYMIIMTKVYKELLKNNKDLSIMSWLKSKVNSGYITKEQYESFVECAKVRNIISHGSEEEVGKIEITDSMMSDCKELLQIIKNAKE